MSLRGLSAILVASTLIGGLLVTGPPGAGATTFPSVSIAGTEFLVDGEVTYPGTAAQGLLLNARMVNAAFDDENPATVGRWAYPDTGRWDADRNVREFVTALPSYAAHGLQAVTINMQGGNPVPGCSCRASHDWITTAFTTNGSLKAAWLERLDLAIRAAADNGLVVILGIFYAGQDQRVVGESAVVRAVDNATDWVLDQGYTNVLIEIANETNNVQHDHNIIKRRVHELIARVQQRSQGRLLVSTGFTGGTIPPDEVVGQADFVLVHGNGQDAAGIRRMVDTIRASSAYRQDPKPIVFNEDSTQLGNLHAAVAAGASWGYYDKGNNDYENGFQAPPVEWAINTTPKRQFFGAVAEYAGEVVAEPTPTLTAEPPSLTLAAPEEGGPVTESVSLRATDGSAVTLAVGTSGDPWLAADPPALTAPGSVTVTADPTGLGPGTYTGTVTAAAEGYDPVAVDVSFTVTGPTSPGYQLQLSPSSTRSPASPLNGATVRGDVHVFVTPDDSVEHVAFHVDDRARARPPYQVEEHAPFDLAGTDVDGRARPFDTSTLAEGEHTITAVIHLSDGRRVLLEAPFTVRQEDVFDLLVSASSDRRSPTRLDGSTVSGDIHVFTTPDTDVDRVHFYLDDPHMSGMPHRTERNAPFDLAGGSVASARAYDTARMPVGEHVVTAVLELTDGTTALTSATFTVTR
ncbi:MAG TPA: hypothetical protein VHF25_04000 [Nitriliruptorales bacterium]|nr:hypothetical protein [Nitriliruptorales bacterium]